MGTKFEILKNEDITPPEQERWIALAESQTAERRKKLLELAIEPDPKMGAWNDHLHKKYSKEWEALGGEGIPDVPVYFFPTSKRAEIAQILERSYSEGWYGSYEPISGAVVVFTESGELASLYSARTLAHELGHGYSSGVIRYKSEKENNHTSLTLNQGGFGMALGTEKGDFGPLLEEYYAVERELEGVKEMEVFFPEEREIEKEILNTMVGENYLTQEAVIYTSVLNSNEQETTSIMSGYMAAHQIGSRIISEIPNSWETLQKARISRNWSDFARKVDARFGQGTFRVVAHVSPTDNNACELLDRFLNEQDENEKKNLAEEIVAISKKESDEE